jgi:hypothetical protein
MEGKTKSCNTEIRAPDPSPTPVHLLVPMEFVKRTPLFRRIQKKGLKGEQPIFALLLLSLSVAAAEDVVRTTGFAGECATPLDPLHPPNSATLTSRAPRSRHARHAHVTRVTLTSRAPRSRHARHAHVTRATLMQRGVAEN